ncbi:MAG: tetratricopeptide repeat protein [Bacteroidia bacterium]
MCINKNQILFSPPNEPVKISVNHLSHNQATGNGYPSLGLLGKNIWIFILFVIISFSQNIFSQSPNFNVEKARKTEKSDLRRLQESDSLTQTFLFTDPDKALIYAEETFELAEKLNKKLYIASTAKNLGIIHSIKGNFDTAKKYNVLAKALFEEIGDTQEVIKITVNLGRMNKERGFYNLAFDYYFEALSLLDTLKEENEGIRLAILTNIGAAKYDYGEPYSSLFYYNNALSLLNEIEDSLWRKNLEAALNLNIGAIFQDQKDCDTALYYLFKAREFYKKNQNSFPAKLAATYHNIANIYYQQGEYPESEKIYLAAIKIREQVDLKGLSSSYGQIGNVYRDQKRYEDAINIITKGINIAKEKGFLKELENGYWYLHEVYERIGNYSEANFALKKYYEIKNSSLNQAGILAIAEMEEKYKDEQKDRQLELRNLEIETRNTWLIFLSGVLIFILVIAFLIDYNRRRIKRDKEKIARLQKDIHHRVKSSLGIVSSLNTSFEKKVKHNNLGKKEILKHIKSLEERIGRIGGLHRHLYEHKDVTQIHFQPYLEKMVNEIDGIYRGDSNISSSIDTKVDLDLDDGILLALIISELVTNSYKYAFPHNYEGKIAIKIVQKNQELVLNITDNGLGFPGNKVPINASGINLVSDFAEQLHAKINFESNHGVHFELKMKNVPKS